MFACKYGTMRLYSAPNFISGFHTSLNARVTDFEQNGNLTIFLFSCDLVTVLDYEGFPGHTICIVRKSGASSC